MGVLLEFVLVYIYIVAFVYYFDSTLSYTGGNDDD